MLKGMLVVWVQREGVHLRVSLCSRAGTHSPLLSCRGEGTKPAAITGRAAWPDVPATCLRPALGSPWGRR